ncbi:MAG: response regulator transcription factor [Muribaculaceae bacterium]|nr:response regulator transcription factor [Muribaculaceae bacterium]
MAKIEDFFSGSNAVREVDEAMYGNLEPLKRAVDAMANATYQCIYIIDYLKRNFLYVSQNQLFLCGNTAEQVQNMGYEFYVKYVPKEEQQMLVELNEAGFAKFNTMPLDTRRSCFMSYDFHLDNSTSRHLVNHKITPFALADDGRVWLAMCVVSLANNSTAGNIEFHLKGEQRYWLYDLDVHCWRECEMVKLRPQDKEVLMLSAQGLTVQQIADKMCRSIDTVKTYKRVLFERLNVNSITEALVTATNSGLI